MARPSSSAGLDDEFGADIAGFARAVVEAATPAGGHKDAATATRYACVYAAWQLERTEDGTSARDLVPATLFGAASVRAYRDSLLAAGVPKGTADARSSLLRRLHPDVGLGGTTRRATSAVAQVAAAPVVVADLSPKMAPELVALLPSMRPLECSKKLWREIGPFVTTAVAAAHAASAQRARDLVRSATRLTAWAHRGGRPLRFELIFDATVVTEFAEAFRPTAHPGSLSTYISNLRCIQTGLGLRSAPPLGSRPSEPGSGLGNLTIAYDDADAAEILGAIERVRSTKRRRHLTAATVLTFGAGYKPKELAWAQTPHIIDVDGLPHAVIHTPERWDLDLDEKMAEAIFGDDFDAPAAPDGLQVRAVVPFNDVWQEPARAVAAAATAFGETFLLGGDGTDRRARVGTVIGDVPVLNLERARLRWQADVLEPLLRPLQAALGTSVIRLNAVFRDWS